MHTVLKLAQIRWTCHAIRMPDERLPKKVYYGLLQEGKRSQGDQKKRYKDTFKASLKDFDMETNCTEAIKVARSHLFYNFTKEQLSMKKRESVKLKESTENERKAKPIGPPAP